MIHLRYLRMLKAQQKEIIKRSDPLFTKLKVLLPLLQILFRNTRIEQEESEDRSLSGAEEAKEKELGLFSARIANDVCESRGTNAEENKHLKMK